jgi:hypothetical protein
MKSESSPIPTPPTPAQLAEIDDVLVTAAELQQVYAGLLRHPRVLATPGSSDVFAACLDQISQDLTLLAAHAADLQARVLPAEIEGATAGDEEPLVPPPRLASLPDIEPPDPQRSVFETVRNAFHLEDFLRQQLLFSLQSAHERRHLQLELQLKMVLLSAEQRCRLLEDRYGFARTGKILFSGLRRQTTRFLNRLQGKSRADLD